MAKLLGIASALALTACSVVGIRGEEAPKYRVVSEAGPIEIRQYDSRIVAETSVPGEEEAARSLGFQRVAHYIFGGNRARQSIAMTAPVATFPQRIDMTAPVAQARDASGGWVVRFFMPAGLTLQTLPAPEDSRVRLLALPPETYAVLRFTGSIAPAAINARRADLLKAVAGMSWRIAGEPVTWFYDPPWTLPFLRRNEVAVRVQPLA